MTGEASHRPGTLPQEWSISTIETTGVFVVSRSVDVLPLGSSAESLPASGNGPAMPSPSSQHVPRDTTYKMGCGEWPTWRRKPHGAVISKRP